jgi:AcrR family transcriptional regulator
MTAQAAHTEPAEPLAAQRLLEAAIESFATKGYHATTTRDISARSGLSSAAVYVHYASKLQLLERICTEGHLSARECLEDALAIEGTHPERIANAVRAFTKWHAENQTVARVVQFEYRALPTSARDVIKALRRDMQALVQRALLDGVAAGVFDVDDVAGTALAITSLCVDVARWYSPQEARSPEQLGQLYAALVLRLLASRPAS